jgi:hypothetical protein
MFSRSFKKCNAAYYAIRTHVAGSRDMTTSTEDIIFVVTTQFCDVMMQRSRSTPELFWLTRDSTV